MIQNPLIRGLLLITGLAFGAFGIRDAGSGPAILPLGLGLALTILPIVAAQPLRAGEVDARPGARDLAAEPRQGTLLMPPRRFVLAAGLSATGLTVFMAALAITLADSEQAPLAVAVVVGLLAVPVAVAAIALLRRTGRREDLALVLAPEGLGPIGARAPWIPWEDVEGVRVGTSAERSLLSPSLDVTTVAGKTHRLSGSLTPMPVVELAALVGRLRDDPEARAGLATGIPAGS